MIEMRENKYKAFIKSLKLAVPVKLIDFAHECILVDLSNGESFAEAEYDFDEVELMRCTGKADVKNKDAFEGDILKQHSISKELFMIIRYGEHSEGCGSNLGFYVEHIRKEQEYFRKDLLFLMDDSEVVGNIFENPELLEVANE